MTASISDLLLVTISIPPRQIEQLLDALARLPHHINPELRYEEWRTWVVFPAYRSWLDDIERTIGLEPFESATLQYTAVAGQA